MRGEGDVVRVGMEAVEALELEGAEEGFAHDGSGARRSSGLYQPLSGDGEGGEGWLGAGDLDVFFQAAYDYHYENGFICIASKSVVNVVTLGFTVVFSTFLLGFVNWPELLTCKSETTCLDFGEYVIGLGWHSSFSFRVFVVLYSLIFSAHWAWTLSALGPQLRKAWEMHRFFSRVLCISTRELQTMEWSEVVERMIALQEQGEYPIQINGTSFSAKDIAMRIMRKNNYMIALVNERVLPVGTIFFQRDTWFLGRNLERMIELCVLEHMFDANHELRRDFSNVAAMQQRFRIAAALNLLAMPFSMAFTVFFSFMKHAEEWHSKRSYLGPRWWSPYALWEFREYNELPHLFEKRTVAAIQHADEFLRQFPAPVSSVLAGGVSFVMGAFVGVLMLFTLMDESILLHIKLDGRNLIWYIAVFSGVLAISRSLVPPLEDVQVFDPAKAMRRVVAFTHYFPDRWRKQAHTYDVRDEFSDYLPYKVELLLKELACILTTPYVLFFVLPEHAERLIDFCKSRTRSVKGVGDVCVYSELDLSELGDPRYGGNNHNSNNNQHDFVRVSPAVKVRGGKLEKSWLNFRLNYPKWKDDQSLDAVLHGFQKSRVEQSLSRSSLSTQQAAAALAASVSDIAANTDPLYSSAERPFFQDSALRPLNAVRYPNSENYFFWMEEYRDACDVQGTHPLA